MLRKLNRDQVHHGVKDASGCILLLYYRLQCYEMAINGKVVREQKTGYATTSSGARSSVKRNEHKKVNDTKVRF